MWRSTSARSMSGSTRSGSSTPGWVMPATASSRPGRGHRESKWERNAMRAVDIIRKKRDGQALSPAELTAMVEGIATGHVADYQWAALLMAILWRGMDAAETAA